MGLRIYWLSSAVKWDPTSPPKKNMSWIWYKTTSEGEAPILEIWEVCSLVQDLNSYRRVRFLPITTTPRASEGEAPILEIWEVCTPWLPCPLWSEVVVPVRISSMGQIDLFIYIPYLMPYTCKLFVLGKVTWSYSQLLLVTCCHITLCKHMNISKLE